MGLLLRRTTKWGDLLSRTTTSQLPPLIAGSAIRRCPRAHFLPLPLPLAFPWVLICVIPLVLRKLEIWSVYLPCT